MAALRLALADGSWLASVEPACWSAVEPGPRDTPDGAWTVPAATVSGPRCPVDCPTWVPVLVNDPVKLSPDVAPLGYACALLPSTVTSPSPLTLSVTGPRPGTLTTNWTRVASLTDCPAAWTLPDWFALPVKLLWLVAAASVAS